MQMLSLGYGPTTAQQLRRRHAAQEAFFFDQLVTPITALPAALLGSDADLLQSGRWSLVQEDRVLLCLNTGLMFPHEFQSEAAAAARILAGRVEQQLPLVRAKYRQLRRQTLSYLRHTPDLLVLRAEELEDFAQTEAHALELRRLLLPLNASLRFAFASSRLPRCQLGDQTLLFKLAALGDARLQARSWDLLFNAAQELFMRPQHRRLVCA